MVRGSFALDMSSLGIGAMVGSLALHKESGTTSLSLNLASRFIKHEEKSLQGVI